MIKGRMVTMRPNYAFALGSDGVQYFVIPSAMATDTLFDELKVGMEVAFIPMRDFPKGPRALTVTTNIAAMGTADLGEGE